MKTVTQIAAKLMELKTRRADEEKWFGKFLRNEYGMLKVTKSTLDETDKQIALLAWVLRDNEDEQGGGDQ